MYSYLISNEKMDVYVKIIEKFWKKSLKIGMAKVKNEKSFNKLEYVVDSMIARIYAMDGNDYIIQVLDEKNRDNKVLSNEKNLKKWNEKE